MLHQFRQKHDPEKQLDDLVLDLMRRFEEGEIPRPILEAALDLQTALRERQQRQWFKHH